MAGIKAVLVFGAGFAIAWCWSSGHGPQPIALRRDVPAWTVDAKASAPGAGQLVGRSDVSGPRLKPALIATTIRKSRLSDWMRFRYEHPHLALSTETAVSLALDAPTPMREITNACVSGGAAEVIHDLDISAEIEIRERDVMVRGWGCDANEDASIAGSICDCVLEYLPHEIRVAVPTEVADKDLASYQGLLSLRLWQ